MPKAYSAALYHGDPRKVVLNNQHFTIKTNGDYKVEITSHPNGVDYEYDYPVLYITVRQKENISGRQSAVTCKTYNYDGKEKEDTIEDCIIYLNFNFK